jgi:hypothetical protein
MDDSNPIDVRLLRLGGLAKRKEQSAKRKDDARFSHEIALFFFRAMRYALCSMRFHFITLSALASTARTKSNPKSEYRNPKQYQKL